LVTEQGYKVSEAALNLGIGVSVLRRWKAEAEAAQQDNGTTADLKAELARLKKENHRLKLERDILGSSGLLCERIGDWYQLIDAEKKAYPVSLMCDVLNVGRRGYYAWQRRQPSARRQEHDKLIPIVKQAHKDTKGTYGARRMAKGRARGTLFNVFNQYYN